MTTPFVVLALLLPLLTLFSYLDRVYTERGKFLAREFQDNLDSYEQLIEPHLGIRPERAALAVALWVQLTLAAIGVLTALWVLHNPNGQTAPVAGWFDWLEAILFLLATVIVCNRLVPYVLFTHTAGRWPRALLPLIRIALWAMLPISAVLGFCLSLAALTHEAPVPVQEKQRESDIEALVEAGAEEGIIEEGERQLVQSALEFGDKRVREIMVPRPDIIALPRHSTAAAVRDLVRQHHLSRLPIYDGDIDHIIGWVQTGDLVLLPEVEMHQQTVATWLHPALFVPESKLTAELLREMQQRHAPLAIVISEYGTVAGLVTLADLVEEIVGEMPTNHSDNSRPDWEEVGPRECLVSGSLELDRFRELLEAPLEARGATTVAGYLAEEIGRIPQAGERLAIPGREGNGLEFEVLEANPVRILRLRVRRSAAVASSPSPVPPPES